LGLSHLAGILYKSDIIVLYFSGLEAYIVVELIMHYQLKTGNRFLFIMDEVADIPCMRSAVNPGSFFWYILCNQSLSS